MKNLTFLFSIKNLNVLSRIIVFLKSEIFNRYYGELTNTAVR